MNNKFEFQHKIIKVGEVPLDDSCNINDENIIKRKRLFGYDNIIGENTFFEINSSNLREDVVSLKSKTINRFRQIVSSIAELNSMDRASSLEEILISKYRNKKILLLEHNSSFASILIFLCKKHDIDLVTSEYFGDKYVSGDMPNGILNLDIQKTHFEDSYFDLIIHSDVFEHVPDALKAEKEQVRILKPNGNVVFTVPFNIGSLKDALYAELLSSGIIKHLKTPIYHDDPVSIDGKCLVFRIFSFSDMLIRYNKLNCEFYCDYVHSEYLGIVGINAFIFVIKKNE